MKTVQSFDIFDTLLARTVQNPTDIFDIVEKTFPYPNFKQKRIIAQNNSNHTMDDIYHQFQLLTNETTETISLLRDFELQTEMKNTIPIKSNILKIKDGDILVSDMYLSHDEISKLLEYHQINPNIKLYVSSNGKSSGTMWEKLIKEYNIKSHTGDNYHSDIFMASKYGIKGIYTQIHKFTTLEYNLKGYLSTLFRTFRLMNTYDETTLEYKIYDQQIQYNIPLLLFMCKKLNTILIEEHRNTVLFLTRDGCLIYKLFSFLYPNWNSYNLYSSRVMNTNYTDEYVSYLKNIYNEDCILFDLHGSFKSGRKLFIDTFGHLPRIFIFDLASMDDYYDKITFITNCKNTIESFNLDYIGSLISFNNNPINMPNEIELKYVDIIHKTLDSFMSFFGKSMDYDVFLNDYFWRDYYTKVVVHCEKILDNEVYHSEYVLTTLANKYNVDKGNKYKCSHHYTIKYQEIISDLLHQRIKDNNMDIFKLLEIGLNRDNTNSISSLMMWNDYFHNYIDITGFDIQPDFNKFNSLYKNIKINIGDQSNIDDLQQLKNKKYDIIIDDGYHASKHQQITFKELWFNVSSNGYYIIEDLHYQPEYETCLKTKKMFEEWKNGNWIESEYISSYDIDQIKSEIKSIMFYDSKSKDWGDLVKNALVYIQKI